MNGHVTMEAIQQSIKEEYQVAKKVRTEALKKLNQQKQTITDTITEKIKAQDPEAKVRDIKKAIQQEISKHRQKIEEAYDIVKGQYAHANQPNYAHYVRVYDENRDYALINGALLTEYLRKLEQADREPIITLVHDHQHLTDSEADKELKPIKADTRLYDAINNPNTYIQPMVRIEHVDKHNPHNRGYMEMNPITNINPIIFPSVATHAIKNSKWVADTQDDEHVHVTLHSHIVAQKTMFSDIDSNETKNARIYSHFTEHEHIFVHHHGALVITHEHDINVHPPVSLHYVTKMPLNDEERITAQNTVTKASRIPTMRSLDVTITISELQKHVNTWLSLCKQYQDKDTYRISITPDHNLQSIIIQSNAQTQKQPFTYPFLENKELYTRWCNRFGTDTHIVIQPEYVRDMLKLLKSLDAEKQIILYFRMNPDKNATQLTIEAKTVHGDAYALILGIVIKHENKNEN